VINELDCTMTVFAFDAARGALNEVETVSTLPPGEAVQPGTSTAEVALHPSGKFLYGSNRGHNTIVVYAVNETTGRLTLVEHVSSGGQRPRNFGIDPSGRFLLSANQDTNNVVVMHLDAATGRLTPTGVTVAIEKPVCVVFAPTR
jgi:6-phosphogluconolactonase